MAANDDQVPGPSKKAKGESIVDLQDVVKILVNDTVFVRNWTRFYDSLRQPSPSYIQWERSFNNNTMKIDQILTEMLSHWVMTLGTEAKVERLYAALISQQFISVGEALSNQYHLSCKIVQTAATSSSNQSKGTIPEWDIPISFDLSEPTENFVGRTTELQMLDTLYQQNNKLIVVSGLGGVGKSELVRKFGVQFRNDVRGNCIWIQGDSEESFKNSVSRLPDYLLLKLESDTDIVDSFIKVYNSKLKQRPILIIVDNVDKSNNLVVKLIKGCKRLLGNVRLIIVTTRNKSVLQIEGGNIELKMLQKNEAVKMVTNGLGSGVSLFEATKLCDTLNHFPLIVQQAISFIKQKRSNPFERNFGVPEYLKLFDKEKRKLLDSPVNDDDNYNSTTFATWRIIVDNLKHMNGSTGWLAVNILRLVPYFDANGVSLSELVRFYHDDNMSHKTCIGSQSDQSRLDSEEIKGAITLIEAYSMCRVDSSVNTGLDGDLKDYKISSHRLIRHFMLLYRDTEMDKEIIRRLFFVGNKFLLDMENVDELAESYKTLVVEMFTKLYKLDDENEKICPSGVEVYKKRFYELLDTDGLDIRFMLSSENISYSLSKSSRLLEVLHTVNQYVKRRYGLDHFLSRFLREEVSDFLTRPSQYYKIPIDTSIGFLVDVMDDGLTNRSELKYWCDSIMKSLLLGSVPIEKTNLVMELKESVTNYYEFNDNYSQQFTFSILTAISQFFKLNEDIGGFNQIQSEISCLMQHPSELITIWHFIRNRLGCPSYVNVFISNKYHDLLGYSTLYYTTDQRLYRKYRGLMESVDILFHESEGICYLDLFAIFTTRMGVTIDKYDTLSAISNMLDSYFVNKDLIFRVYKTICTSAEAEDLLSLYTEITESVRNGLVNRYQGIWSLGQIFKALLELDDHDMGVQIELIDTLEGLVNTEKDKELVKTIIYSITDGFVWNAVKSINRFKNKYDDDYDTDDYDTDDNDTDDYDSDIDGSDISKVYWSDILPLFLRLQKYGIYFPMLKQILHSASVGQIKTIGSNIIDNHRKGLINKPDTFLAIKQVVKSFLKKQEMEKALGILCQTLNIEHLIPLDGNQKKLLLEKVQSTVVHLDDINIVIATYFCFRECMELDDPREFGYPCILLLQILKILCKEQNPTKLLALCYEIYHFGEGASKLKCWALIQILKLIAEMNRNDLAERFLRKIIRKHTLNDWLWYYKSCWFLVFGTYYKSGLVTESTSDTLKVEDCVKILESFDALIKDKVSSVID